MCGCLLLDDSQLTVTLQEAGCWGKRQPRTTFELPQVYPWGVSLFADGFSLPTGMELAKPFLYIAGEEAAENSHSEKQSNWNK